MATFLRFLSGLIGFLYVQAALVGGVLALLLHEHSPDRVLAPLLLSMGVVLLTIAGVTAGALVSYLRFEDPESRRRVRPRLVVLGVLGLVGVVVQLVSVALGVPVWFAVPVAVIGVLLVLVFVVLGRAARRREVPRPAGDAVGRVDRELRRGYRISAVCFAAGLVAGTLLVVVLTATLGSHDGVDGEAVVLAVTLACCGGAIGGLAAQLRISRIVREVVGPEYARVRRIARVVLRGKDDPLSDDEQASAELYARVIGGLLLMQTLAYLLLYVGILLNEVGLVMNAHGRDPIPVVLLPLLVGLLVWFSVLMAMRIRRARAYAAAHPVPTPA